jgi:hypothetical protein
MADLTFVTYCGLYCKSCSARGRIPQQAQALKQSLEKEGFTAWGPQVFPNFEAFWTLMSDLGDHDKACPGCRAGGGYPACEIRVCARERAVDICALCEDFPCDRIQQFTRRYPTLLVDGQRLKEIGIDAWIAEQEDRVKCGFIYSDCRIETG